MPRLTDVTRSRRPRSKPARSAISSEQLGAARFVLGGERLVHDFVEHQRILAFIIGALVLGAFAPRKTASFAASGLRQLIQAMLQASKE